MHSAIAMRSHNLNAHDIRYVLGPLFPVLIPIALKIMACKNGCFTIAAAAAVKVIVMHFYLCDYTIKLPLVSVQVGACVCAQFEFPLTCKQQQFPHKNALATAKVVIETNRNENSFKIECIFI